MSKQEDKIKAGAAEYLDAGEDVLAAVIARPRGWTTQMAGGGAGLHIGGKKVAEANAAGSEAGLALASPMAFLVTSQRVMVLKISSPVGLGIGGEVKEFVSALPIADVQDITLTRLGLGKIISVHAGGEEIKLEVNAKADSNGIRDSFARVKGGG